MEIGVEPTGLPRSGRMARIHEYLQPLLAREERAYELRELVPARRIYFGLCGIAYDCEPFDIIPDFLTVRAVGNAPGIVHVCRAAKLDATDYLGVARYSHLVSAELAAGGGDAESYLEPKLLDGIAWHTAALLKLRGAESLFCRASSTVSWDLLASVDDQSVVLRMLDDVPRQLLTSGSSPRCLVPADLEWARDRWDAAFVLRDAATSRRFGLAFNIAYIWNHTAEPRIAISNLWCGLDALFGKKNDRPLTRRLLERIVRWLPDGDEEDVAQLYEARCDAIHGRWMNDADLRTILGRTARLLRGSLILCIDEGRKTLPDWGE